MLIFINGIEFTNSILFLKLDQKGLPEFCKFLKITEFVMFLEKLRSKVIILTAFVDNYSDQKTGNIFGMETL